MDPANVAMVIFKLLSSSFTEYNVNKPIDLAINLSNLKQILRRAGPNDILEVEMDDQNNKLKIKLRGNNTRTFSLPIIELDEREQKIPDLSFGATIRTASDVFSQAIEDAEIAGESVSFIVNKNGFSVRSAGEISDANIDIPTDDVTSVTLHEKGVDLKAKYSIEYLKKMIVGSKLANEVLIHFNNDYPLKLDYKTTDRLLLSFILAPRVEND